MCVCVSTCSGVLLHTRISITQVLYGRDVVSSIQKKQPNWDVCLCPKLPLAHLERKWQLDSRLPPSTQPCILFVFFFKVFRSVQSVCVFRPVYVHVWYTEESCLYERNLTAEPGFSFKAIFSWRMYVLQGSNWATRRQLFPGLWLFQCFLKVYSKLKKSPSSNQVVIKRRNWYMVWKTCGMSLRILLLLDLLVKMLYPWWDATYLIITLFEEVPFSGNMTDMIFKACRSFRHRLVTFLGVSQVST